MFVIIPDEMCIEKASSILGYFCIVGVPRHPNNTKIPGNPKSGFVTIRIYFCVCVLGGVAAQNNKHKSKFG